jgi:3',5'-cyclic AMP phosphodiesterase CpdA
MIVAQLSDSHITTPDSASAAALKRAVDYLLGLPAQPDVVLLTGDCTEHGTAEEYACVRELLRPLPMPVYVVPGNHDNREQLLHAFGVQGSHQLPGFVQYAIEAGPLRLLALDTHIPDRNEGELCAERLAWLEARLSEAPDRPTLLLMHHPPFRVGQSAFDSIGLQDAETFGALVARHPQIEAIVAGHVHATVLRRFYGTVAITAPATAHQLLPDLRETTRLRVVQEPPGCLLHVWSADTGLLTRTSTIGDHGPVKELHDGTRWL